MVSCTAQDVASSLGELVGRDEKIIAECLSICHNFNMSPDDLRWKLEAVSFSTNKNTPHSVLKNITLDSVLALKVQLQREVGREKKAQTRTSTVSANVNKMRTPAVLNRSIKLPGPAVSSGRTVVAQVKQEEVQVAGPSRVVFYGPKQDEKAKNQRAYRYMFEKQMERSENLDQMIDDAADIVRSHFKLDDIGDPGTTTDEDVVIVGRIFSDVDVEAEKLTESSLFLESSRMLSGGARIALKFHPALVIRNNIRGARGLGFFPGAIVALKGRNGGGGYFLVNEVLTLPIPNPTAPVSGENTMKVDPVESGAFSLIAACGPFTADSDLSYTFLASLVEAAKKDKPSALLLVGPFVDANHPSIRVGDLDSTPVELFHEKIYSSIKSFLDASPGSIAILLPDVRDLLSNHAVYPQSELSRDLVKNDPRIHLIPNPSRFKINDVSFGACSVDVLFHLRKEEFLKLGREVDPVLPVHEDDVGTDVMANTCRHLLQQRSFYPIFPTPPGLAHEVNMDVSHSDGLKLVDGDNLNPPDVLILPSKLKHFVKMVHSTTVINASFLNRNTYALLKVAEGSGGMSSVKQRLSCEVVRLSE
ncbi:hypothetical protein Agabi119p4_7336 [Agaricus bisporus var. burnettii]|uniref:DNA polymerase alpha subunit B n=1 Tax=Agaricus bisporus var. burnettii TaxID=192524 RepID=A0A8H7EYT8_AGABI|nr:hypothetical protein Agabi119p4_7336 [Agaricus bisporus var. burnettii]